MFIFVDCCILQTSHEIYICKRRITFLSRLVGKTSKNSLFAVAGRVRLTSVRIFRSIFVPFLTSSASQTPAAVMANFGDLKSDGGLNKLNGFLSSKSYIEGSVSKISVKSMYTFDPFVSPTLSLSGKHILNIPL